ncbi:hypothetical protein C482_06864 [Natrialba chahannaoensis JCM 10990]|uniref:Uncharacterized protein n=1 Tax=Natrialba chahannaoensis JCM 10990 TaxID=1227492 RepID=M0ASG4_9EURY|nr:hypothetical protein [Natrialba chahannaoensis]ELZ01475.1 hypothetical protein C482_06864 [Natrialba chahannaoensis JCM 10990]
MSANERSADASATVGGFGTFFRNYTKTWIHTVATVGLTAFGTLTFVHRWFAALAFASYLLPPVILYIRWRRQAGELDAFSAHSSSSQSETDSDDAASEADHTVSDAADRADQRTDESDQRRALESEPESVSDPEPETESAPTSVSGSGTESDARSEAVSAFETVPESEVEPEPESEPESQSDDDPEERPSPDRWRLQSSPVDATLHDVIVTDSGRSYAVGDGGVVLASGDEWETVLDDGPGASGADLFGVDATDDGGAVWVAVDILPALKGEDSRVGILWFTT